MHRLVPVATLTGRPILNQVDALSGSWTTSITSPGDGSFVIPTRDQKRTYDPSLLDRLCKGWGTTYVVEWIEHEAFQRFGTVLYAGLVVDVEWDEDSGNVTVKTKELAAILAYRLLYSVGQYASGTRHIYGATLRDVIREVFRYAIAGGAPRWALPVDLPGYTSGSVYRPYWRYSFQSALAFLEQLQSEDGAPDVYLRPRWVGSALRWDLQVGAPHLVDENLRLPVAGPRSRVKSSVTGLKTRTSFQGQRTGVFTIGQGSEEDMRHGEAGGSDTWIDPDVPYLDATQSFKQVDDLGVLKSLSLATLKQSTGGITQWSFGVTCEGRVKPADIRVGRTMLLDHPGSERVAQGRYRHMTLAVSGSLGSAHVKVEAQGF